MNGPIKLSADPRFQKVLLEEQGWTARQTQDLGHLKEKVLLGARHSALLGWFKASVLSAGAVAAAVALLHQDQPFRPSLTPAEPNLAGCVGASPCPPPQPLRFRPPAPAVEVRFLNPTKPSSSTTPRSVRLDKGRPSTSAPPKTGSQEGKPKREADPKPPPNKVPTSNLAHEVAQKAPPPEKLPLRNLASEPAQKAAPPKKVPLGNLAHELGAYQTGRSALHDGEFALAKQRLRDYLARFPEGRLKLEATLDLAEVTFRLGQHQEALVLARELFANPKAKHRKTEIQRWIVHLETSLGHCAAAKIAAGGNEGLLSVAERCQDRRE